MTDEFTETLADRLETELDCPAAVGDEIAARADTLHADHAEADLTVDAFLARVREAPYEAFDRRWNWAVGDICHELDGCTDSRPYRLEGFGEVGATN